jgi:hypothetical protein
MMQTQDNYYTFYLKIVLSAIVIVLFLSTAGIAEDSGFSPTITVSPAVAEYKPKVKVLISGSGFEPNQELQFQISMGGVLSLIHASVKPSPVPNEFGAFAGVWTINREISRKLLKPLPVVYTITVLDEDFNKLCSAALLFCDSKEEKKPEPCSFLE